MRMVRADEILTVLARLKDARMDGRTWLRYAMALGLFTYLTALIFMFPAGVVWNRLAGETHAIRLDTSDATLWHGQEQPLEVDGVSSLIGWWINPLALLGGRIGYFIDVDYADNQFEMDLRWGLGGEAELVDATGEIALDALFDILRTVAEGVAFPVVPGGILVFDRLRIEPLQGWPSHVQGRAAIKNLEIAGTALMDWEGELASHADGGVKAVFRSANTMLDGGFSLAFSEDGALTVAWKLKERQAASDDLIKKLSLLGRKDVNGFRSGSFRAVWRP